jgi:hypothetical protein
MTVQDRRAGCAPETRAVTRARQATARRWRLGPRPPVAFQALGEAVRPCRAYRQKSLNRVGANSVYLTVWGRLPAPREGRCDQANSIALRALLPRWVIQQHAACPLTRQLFSGADNRVHRNGGARLDDGPPIAVAVPDATRTAHVPGAQCELAWRHVLSRNGAGEVIVPFEAPGDRPSTPLSRGRPRRGSAAVYRACPFHCRTPSKAPGARRQEDRGSYAKMARPRCTSDRRL